MIDLSRVDIFGNETETINTANCYVIREDGDYCFPLVYGNGVKDGKDNKESYTNSKPEERFFLNYMDYKGRIITSPYIKDKIEKVDVIWKSDGIEIEKLKCEDDYFYFTLTKNKRAKQGENALIGIYDEEGKVIWSWHIWFYKGDDLEIIPIKDRIKHKKIPKHLQYQLLSINLGWDGENNTLYQWGRKDPFRSYIEGISIREDSLSIYNSISNPDKFFTDYKFNGYVNLWDSRCDGFVDKDAQFPNHTKLSIKTIYDPCPPEFKVPGCDIFEEFDKLGSWWKNDDGKIFGNRIFLPITGYRGRGSGGFCVSCGGYYWSSASFSQYGAFYFSFISEFVYPLNSYYRAYGFSIRPIKEN